MGLAGRLILMALWCHSGSPWWRMQVVYKWIQLEEERWLRLQSREQTLLGSRQLSLIVCTWPPLSFLSDPLLSIAQPFFLSSAREFKHLSRTFFIYWMERTASISFSNSISMSFVHQVRACSLACPSLKLHLLTDGSHMVTSGLLTVLTKSVLVKTRESRRLEKIAKKIRTRLLEGAQFNFGFKYTAGYNFYPKMDSWISASTRRKHALFSFSKPCLNFPLSFLLRWVPLIFPKPV